MNKIKHEIKLLYLLVKNSAHLLFCKNSKDFLDLKNTYEGKRCFIVGYGPSLTIDDLNTLKANKEICISMNRIYRLFGSTRWRPDIYFISDPAVFDEDTKKNISCMLNENKTMIYSKFLIKNMNKGVIPYKTNIIRRIFNLSNILLFKNKGGRCLFSLNARKYIYDGESCVHSIIQLAYYLGFSKVYLLGVDCGTNNGISYNSVMGLKNNSAYNNSSDSFLIQDFQSVYDDMKKKKIPMEVYNATRGGLLEVFPRVHFDSLFK